TSTVRVPFYPTVNRLPLAVRFCIGLLPALFAAFAASAHPVAQGSMELGIYPNKIRVQVRVSMEEVFVQNALSTGAREGNVAADELCRRHGDYLLQHLHVLVDDKPVAGRVTRV